MQQRLAGVLHLPLLVQQQQLVLVVLLQANHSVAIHKQQPQQWTTGRLSNPLLCQWQPAVVVLLLVVVCWTQAC